MPQDITVFRARRIVTMNPSRPTATHVAVTEGRVLMVGSADDVATLGPATLDETFADKVLLPGFVEGHAHVMEGSVWAMTYAGYHDRVSPEGVLVTGLTSIDEVVERLKEANAASTDKTSTLYAWGFDPIYFGGRRMDRHDLDKVSTTRPVMVVHASLHISNVNTLVLDKAGFDSSTNIEGVAKLPDGTPSGELQGIAARLRAFRAMGDSPFPLGGGLPREHIARFASAALVKGITTVTDLHCDLSDGIVASYRSALDGDDLPIRVVPAFAALSMPAEDGVKRLAELVPTSSDRLHIGLVKLVVDGSIQGFTARVRWPGYHNGTPNGLWYIAPEELPRIVDTFHRAGLRMHIHTNGDQATEAALDAVEAALVATPRADHRHTLQHCQLADAAQFRRMKALGMCVNLFSNHSYYWGDAHFEQTVGPERACRMNAAATALRNGVPLAIHSDAPVTPLGPLFVAWCAVNRLSSSGRLMGAEERISVAEAIHAVTLGPAFTLGLDHLVGSIEVGKYADFAVLEEDPFEVDPAALKDVPVWGVVSGGKIFEAPRG